MEEEEEDWAPAAASTEPPPRDTTEILPGRGVKLDRGCDNIRDWYPKDGLSESVARARKLIDNDDEEDDVPLHATTDAATATIHRIDDRRVVMLGWCD